MRCIDGRVWRTVMMTLACSHRRSCSGMPSSTTTTRFEISHAPATNTGVSNVHRNNADTPLNRIPPASGGIEGTPVTCRCPDEGAPGPPTTSGDGSGGAVRHPESDHRVQVRIPVLPTRIDTSTQTFLTRQSRDASSSSQETGINTQSPQATRRTEGGNETLTPNNQR